LERLPTAVVAHLANEFLGDAEAIRLARASRDLLCALQRHRLKRCFSLDLALQWSRPGAAADGRSAADRFLSASSLSATPFVLSTRIGVLARVEVDDAEDVCGQAEMDRLPPSVRILDWHSGSDGATAARPLLQSLRLPPQLRQLRFWTFFNEPVNLLQLPPSLTAIEFGRDFNQSVSGLILPDNLRSLSFGSSFEQPLSALQLPPSLTALHLGGFRGTVADLPALPPTLEVLSFGDRFNAPLDGLTLPPSLTALTFGLRFNQPVDSLQWPQGLHSLKFGCEWNQSVERLQLPDSLTELHMRGCTQPLNWPQPPRGVTKLALCDYWNHPSSQLRLPPALAEITLPSAFNQPLDDLELPASVRSLTLSRSLTHPLSGLHLSALTALNAVDYQGSAEGVRWPPALTELAAGSRFAAAGLLPESLLILSLDCIRQWLLPLGEVDLPPRLQRLTLHLPCELEPVDLRLPPSLTALALDGDFDQPLTDWTPPAGLRELRLGGWWDNSVAALRLPPRLEVLTLSRGFNHPVEQLALPPSLTELHLGVSRSAAFSKTVSGLRLPAGLRVLSLPSFGRTNDSAALLAPPAVIPPSLRELRVHPNGAQFGRLSQWDLPPRCVVSLSAYEF